MYQRIDKYYVNEGEEESTSIDEDYDPEIDMCDPADHRYPEGVSEVQEDEANGKGRRYLQK